MSEEVRSRALEWQDPVATAEATLTAADSGKLLAHGVATCMILGG